MERKRLEEAIAERKAKREAELEALKLQNEAELKVIFSKLRNYDIEDSYFRRFNCNTNVK